ncbi:MAG: DegQ family serine endoprotease [Betaproteobacteria bacterium]|nr:DegQ family serine endoprotease [Betaproteobacteria bacterium]MBI2959403.1 DegQ family serine endoprotease [Betaproteobacteria bacterium]
MLAQATPAVVNISVVMRDPGENNPLLRDPFFRRFFNLPEQPRTEQSAGSGVIVDAGRGLVLTNHHVIKDAQEVVVTLKDRRALKAQLAGADPGTDIALLRIPAENLTALKFGDSDALQVGDFVVAIGNPFGIGQTVTSGIVSALGRSGLGIEGYEDFIQTDASINPGNSGGALVNLRGELVGINTAIIGPAGGNVGIGFAVPAAMARQVMAQILRFGEVRRGRLGVSTADLTPETAKQFGVRSGEGAVVVAVEPGSPADKAGLKKGDVLVSANGRPIRGAADVRNRVGLTPVGEEITLGVERSGGRTEIRARVGEPFAVTGAAGEAVPQLAGARVANIEPGMPMYGQVLGVIVASVEAKSAAARNGLRAGDIIYGVGRRRVRSVSAFLAALRAAEAPLRLTLLRGEYRITLTIR